MPDEPDSVGKYLSSLATTLAKKYFGDSALYQKKYQEQFNEDIKKFFINNSTTILIDNDVTIYNKLLDFFSQKLKDVKVPDPVTASTDRVMVLQDTSSGLKQSAKASQDKKDKDTSPSEKFTRHAKATDDQKKLKQFESFDNATFLSMLTRSVLKSGDPYIERKYRDAMIRGYTNKMIDHKERDGIPAKAIHAQFKGALELFQAQYRQASTPVDPKEPIPHLLNILLANEGDERDAAIDKMYSSYADDPDPIGPVEIIGLAGDYANSITARSGINDQPIVDLGKQHILDQDEYQHRQEHMPPQQVSDDFKAESATKVNEVRQARLHDIITLKIKIRDLLKSESDDTKKTAEPLLKSLSPLTNQLDKERVSSEEMDNIAEQMDKIERQYYGLLMSTVKEECTKLENEVAAAKAGLGNASHTFVVGERKLESLQQQLKEITQKLTSLRSTITLDESKGATGEFTEEEKKRVDDARADLIEQFTKFNNIARDIKGSLTSYSRRKTGLERNIRALKGETQKWLRSGSLLIDNAANTIIDNLSQLEEQLKEQTMTSEQIDAINNKYLSYSAIRLYLEKSVLEKKDLFIQLEQFPDARIKETHLDPIYREAQKVLNDLVTPPSLGEERKLIDSAPLETLLESMEKGLSAARHTRNMIDIKTPMEEAIVAISNKTPQEMLKYLHLLNEKYPDLLDKYLLTYDQDPTGVKNQRETFKGIVNEDTKANQRRELSKDEESSIQAYRNTYLTLLIDQLYLNNVPHSTLLDTLSKIQSNLYKDLLGKEIDPNAFKEMKELADNALDPLIRLQACIKVVDVLTRGKGNTGVKDTEKQSVIEQYSTIIRDYRLNNTPTYNEYQRNLYSELLTYQYRDEEKYEKMKELADNALHPLTKLRACLKVASFLKHTKGCASLSQAQREEDKKKYYDIIKNYEIKETGVVEIDLEAIKLVAAYNREDKGTEQRTQAYEALSNYYDEHVDELDTDLKVEIGRVVGYKEKKLKEHKDQFVKLMKQSENDPRKNLGGIVGLIIKSRLFQKIIDIKHGIKFKHIHRKFGRQFRQKSEGDKSFHEKLMTHLRKGNNKSQNVSEIVKNVGELMQTKKKQ